VKRFTQVFRVLGLSLLALAAVASLPAEAQTYPTRTITLVVPFAAGGPSDAIARLLGQSMSATLKGQIVIENVAGAGGTAGAARVAKAEPDGHTLLIAHVALPAAASLYKSLPYDTLRDFEPLGLVNYGPMVLATKKDLPVANAGEFFARLKGGTPVTLAHAGIGSNAHLCGLLLQQALGAKVTEVAYRGTGPAMNDLVGGQVDALCDQSTNAVPQVQGNTVKALAVTSTGRLDVLPNVPTMQEAGLANFEFIIWHGLYAPKGTPEPVVAALNRALRVALDDAGVKARFAEVGTQIFPAAELTADAHKARFEKEAATWRDVIAKADVKIGN
jgi:tripartite-type tricarboxylate transporter receptor subunit TctC